MTDEELRVWIRWLCSSLARKSVPLTAFTALGSNWHWALKFFLIRFSEKKKLLRKKFSFVPSTQYEPVNSQGPREKHKHRLYTTMWISCLVCHWHGRLRWLEILCLQVRVSYYSGVLSESFIFTWTAVTNNAFDICKNASYCCTRKYETWTQYPWIMRGSHL